MTRRKRSRLLSRRYEPTFLDFLCLRSDDVIYDFEEDYYEEDDHSYIQEYDNRGILYGCLSGFISSSDSEDDHDDESSFSRIARRRQQARALEKRRKELLGQKQIHSSISQISKNSSKPMNYNEFNYHPSQVMTDEDNDCILNLQLPIMTIQQPTVFINQEKIIQAAYADYCSSADEEDDRYRPFKPSPPISSSQVESKEEDSSAPENSNILTEATRTDNDNEQEQEQEKSLKDNENDAVELTSQTENVSSQENNFSTERTNDGTGSTVSIEICDKNKGENDIIKDEGPCKSKFDLNDGKRIDLENVSDAGSVMSYEKRMADIMKVGQKSTDDKNDLGNEQNEVSNEASKENIAPHGDLSYDPVREFRSNYSDDEDGISISIDALNEMFQNRYKIDDVHVDINPLDKDPISTIRSEDAIDDEDILKPDTNQELESGEKDNRPNKFASLLSEMRLARIGVEAALESYDKETVQPLSQNINPDKSGVLRNRNSGKKQEDNSTSSPRSVYTKTIFKPKDLPSTPKKTKDCSKTEWYSRYSPTSSNFHGAPALSYESSFSFDSTRDENCEKNARSPVSVDTVANKHQALELYVHQIIQKF